MRIQELRIERYGPIQDLTLHFNDDIILVYGPNESGKTLTVDALLKMLVGRAATQHWNMDRVKEQPEGYLVVNVDSKETKLERNQTLFDIISQNSSFPELGCEEFRNIFVIRDSDLNLVEASKYYGNLIDKISGARTNEINIIIESLRDYGRLTPTHKIADSQFHDYAYSTKEEARSLVDDLKGYVKAASQEGIQYLEIETMKFRERKTYLQERKSHLKVVKKWLELQDISKKIKDVKETLSTITEIHKDKLMELQRRITLHNKSSSEYASLESNRRILANSAIVAFVCGILATIVIGGMFGNMVFGFSLFSLSIVLFIFLILSALYMNLKLSKIIKNEYTLLEDGRTYGISSKDLSQLKSKVNVRIEQINTAENQMHQTWGVIKDSLKMKEKNPNIGIGKAEAKIDTIIAEMDEPDSLDFNYDEYEECERDLQSLEEKLTESEKKLEKHKNKMNEFNKQYLGLNCGRFSETDTNFQISTLEVISRAILVLEEVANNIEKQATLSTKAISLFSEIQDEERAKISDLFGSSANPSTIFSKITNNSYKSVEYNEETQKLEVTRSNGEKKSIYLLSRGATDQLYLSVRISLARSVLGDHKGFFIIDDAFIASDKDRLEAQVEVLKQLSSEGWQIIYFTSKYDTFRAMKRLASLTPIKLSSLV